MAYECLPLGGGDELRVFPDGAYVPNEWIDLATDSVADWREGSEKERNCVLRVVSLNTTLHAERGKTEQANKNTDTMRTSRDGFETLYNAEHATTLLLTTKVGRRGKMVLALGITTVAFLATTTLLAIPDLSR